MHSAMQSHSAFLRAFCQRGTALLLVMSLGTTLLSVGSVAQAQEARAAFHAQKGFRADLAEAPGLYIATYQTPQGKILVYLPDDLHVAESVIGTMRLEPKGKEEGVREANRAVLATYHFLWGGQSQPAQEAPLSWALPSGNPLEADKLTLADPLDHPLSQAELPVAASPPTSPADASAPVDARTASNSVGSDKISLPRKGVVGRPLVLQGPVGADALTYQVLVGNKPARLLAASPRLLIVESPPDVLGKTTLQVKKNDQVLVQSAFQNDHTIRRTNPWPYVIGAGLVTGIVIAVSINNTLHHLGDGLGNIHIP